MAPLLEARNVGKVYGGGLFSKKRTVALESASLVLQDSRPSITAIAGESGSGKTTLARLLLGMVKPTSGEMFYQGTELSRMNRGEWKRFRREVQAVFQDPFEVYNPFYKVDHALTLPVEKYYPKASAAESRTLIEDALRAVGLRPEETLGRYPHQLSGGQRQRIMTARALVLRPRIIVADEPVSMVDASLRATILESLLNVHREFGISLIYITHDLTTAYQLCETILMMYRGTVVEAGNIDLVIKEPQHPYTQLLVDSIPLPNPKLQWGQLDFNGRGNQDGAGAGQGCPFANRCPHVMDICRQQRPPNFQTNPRRAVACFLYQDAPVAQWDEVMALPPVAAQPAAGQSPTAPQPV
jgi:oligopeptide/dipeptide ABC transporter ATP-binding protein